MDDYADYIQINITNRDDPFGYGLPDTYSSAFISINGDIKPSDVTKIMESIIFSGETRIPDWFYTEEKYKRAYAGASSGGFEYLLTISGGIIANIITEIGKKLFTHLRPQEENYDLQNALHDSYAILKSESDLDKKDVLLHEQITLNNEFRFIFKNRNKRRYYVIKINKSHVIVYFHACRSIKEASE